MLQNRTAVLQVTLSKAKFLRWTVKNNTFYQEMSLYIYSISSIFLLLVYIFGQTCSYKKEDICFIYFSSVLAPPTLEFSRRCAFLASNWRCWLSDWCDTCVDNHKKVRVTHRQLTSMSWFDSQTTEVIRALLVLTVWLSSPQLNPGKRDRYY